ncbi:MAG: branched-chain amino acid ABC transporter substrate-binding protein, partial [Burkholderiaceae bacterium]
MYSSKKQPLKNVLKSTALAALLLGGTAATLPALAQKGETVKIGWIDPLSGLMGPVGQNQVKSMQFFAEKFNKSNPAGVKFEIIPIDNKLSPAESLNALKSAIDQGARYIVQGNGSSVALALIDAINKHNERNPGKEVIFLNDAAVDPDLTNSKCSYWHFRFDADTSMKMEAITTFLKDQPDVKKVFLLNQNYSHGHQVAKYAKELLARKRPDIQIVGEDLHPIAQVRDFAPYVAKIKASGADMVITGNWGSDLTLLIKAANEAGYTGKFFTYYAGVTGAPTAIGAAGAGRVYQVAYNYNNMGGEMDKLANEFKDKFNDDFYTGSVMHIYTALGEAMAKAKS